MSPAHASSTESVHPAPVPFGRYLLHEKLGHGGMAAVYRAEMHGLVGFSKIVALKLVHPTWLSHPEFSRFFMGEAVLGGFLSHPNIVETLDFGEHEGRLFLAMEYVPGPTLEQVLQLHRTLARPIPLDIVFQLLLQVAAGLEYAHEAVDHDGHPLHLVHRDLKPSNILLSRHGVAKVADFGVARADSNLSQTEHSGVVKGTVRYMSPEQAWGSRDLDRRSDLFALGLILYELVTLETLYEGDSPQRLLRRAQDAEVAERLERIPPSPVQEELLALLERLLAREPDARPGSAAEVADALSALLETFPEHTHLKAWTTAVCAEVLPAHLRRLASGSGSDPHGGTPRAISGPELAGLEAGLDDTPWTLRVAPTLVIDVSSEPPAAASSPGAAGPGALGEAVGAPDPEIHGPGAAVGASDPEIPGPGAAVGASDPEIHGPGAAVGASDPEIHGPGAAVGAPGAAVGSASGFQADMPARGLGGTLAGAPTAQGIVASDAHRGGPLEQGAPSRSPSRAWRVRRPAAVAVLAAAALMAFRWAETDGPATGQRLTALSASAYHGATDPPLSIRRAVAGLPWSTADVAAAVSAAGSGATGATPVAEPGAGAAAEHRSDAAAFPAGGAGANGSPAGSSPINPGSSAHGDPRLSAPRAGALPPAGPQGPSRAGALTRVTSNSAGSIPRSGVHGGRPASDVGRATAGRSSLDPASCRQVEGSDGTPGLSCTDGQDAPPLTGEGSGERSLPRDSQRRFSIVSGEGSGERSLPRDSQRRFSIVSGEGSGERSLPRDTAAVGTLILNSRPPASVYLDDMLVGSSQGGHLSVPAGPGEHALTFVSLGTQQRLERTVQVTAAQSQRCVAYFEAGNVECR